MLDTIRKLPVISSLSVAFGAAAALTAGGVEVLAAPVFVGAAASPFVNAALMLGSVLDLADKSRSKLSKVFSGAALGVGALGYAAFGAYIGQPGFEAMSAYIMTSLAMVGMGSLNLASHFTQDKNLRLRASVEVMDTKKSDPAPKP